MNEINTLFQSTQQDVSKLYEALWTLILSVSSRVMKPLFLDKARKSENIADVVVALENELALKDTKVTDYGYEFQVLVSKCAGRSSYQMSTVFDCFVLRTRQKNAK